MLSNTLKIILLLVVISACSPGQVGYGYKEIKCWNEGELIYQGQWEHCPSYAGEGYSELESGEVINAVCICSTDR
jgi:hypothetical protein